MQKDSIIQNLNLQDASQYELVEKYVFNQKFIQNIAIEVSSKIQIGFFIISDLEDSTLVPAGFCEELEAMT